MSQGAYVTNGSQETITFQSVAITQELVPGGTLQLVFRFYMAAAGAPEAQRKGVNPEGRGQPANTQAVSISNIGQTTLVFTPVVRRLSGEVIIPPGRMGDLTITSYTVTVGEPGGPDPDE